jgi:hypothetical protein
MQDNALGTIWGEDLRTGGGGANVWTYSDFATQLPPNNQGPFLPLPGQQDMRVAWRDAIRAGLHQGDVLEDYGVFADRSAPLRLDDVLAANAPQIDRIARDLAEQAPSYVGRVSFADGGKAALFVKTGAELDIPATVAGTTSVEYLSDGASLSEQPLDAVGSVVLVPAGISAATTGWHRLEIRGKNGCEASWRAFRWVYVMP